MKTNAIFSKKQLFGVCCALLLSPMAVFGQLIVGKSLGADHTADEQKALAVTKNGDMYISINANSFQIMKDDGTFDEIKNPYQESTTRAGILTKISADGKLLWSNMVCVQESANNSQVTSVCEVGDYLYVVGGVRTNVKGEHPVSVFGIPLVSQGEMDYYIAKLNAATGEAVWAKTFGGVRNWLPMRPGTCMPWLLLAMYRVHLWKCLSKTVLLLLWPLQTIGAKIIYL